MDLLRELENMATNIEDEYDTENYRLAEDEIARWQKLFSYSYIEAVEQITNQRGNLLRNRVSDELWDLLRSEKEAQGYSREAFEHEISMRSRHNNPIPTHPQPVDTSISPSRLDFTYLVLLSGPFTSAEQIQTIASLPSSPSTCSATSEGTGNSQLFCRITASTKTILQSWLSREHPWCAPTFVRVSRARKDLDSASRYPTLGMDSTLPQYRLSSISPTDPSLLPAQDEYPAYYFFYGTLANPDFLAQVLCLPEEEGKEEDNDDKELPILKPAHIIGGVLKTWGRKYKALIDGAASDLVSGVAYQVTTREREEALLIYEGEPYEVVRCAITVEGTEGIVRGLTFRFVGS